ncbi:MAG: hypothetical protein SGILL_008362, partial [Bacillariaceae sp.]
RMAKGEDAIPYDDWDKERKEALEKEQKEAERKRKEEEKRRKEEQRKAREAAKKDEDDDSESESFTEKELAEMRGYKKTKDGRVTSYFTRETTNQIDIAPKPISTGPQPITPSPVAVGGTGKGTSSAWNHAGTWEEKDTTEWCKDHLTTRLKETKVEAGGSMIGVVTEVNDVTGDASVAVVGGKKRYIFDLHCNIKFDVKEADTDDILASGKFRLPDICSTHHEELEVEFDGWKKKPTSDHETVANDCRQRIASEVRESVKLWLRDFNENY